MGTHPPLLLGLTLIHSQKGIQILIQVLIQMLIQMQIQIQIWAPPLFSLDGLWCIHSTLWIEAIGSVSLSILIQKPVLTEVKFDYTIYCQNMNSTSFSIISGLEGGQPKSFYKTKRRRVDHFLSGTCLSHNWTQRWQDINMDKYLLLLYIQRI